tara:strand:+ start:118 stop:381 length:264 start_codon:yes stop_codon:yes gene_type:complete
MENKITKEELKTIQDQQLKINSILNKVGYLESEKHGLLHELAGVNNDVEEFKNKLEKEYGAVNINLEDGTYTNVEKEKEEEVAVGHV